MNLIKQVEQEIRRRKLLRAGQRVAVACSGGADSVALLRLLDALKDSLGIRLLVCHLNHGLRGGESDGDEAFVHDLAGGLRIGLVSQREDVGARAGRAKQNLEEAAREARLEFFASLIEEGLADVVAVGHTVEDQAETVLARIVRGAGTRGLAGIYPKVEERGPRLWRDKLRPSSKPSLVLVRPLLGIRRKKLREHLRGLEQDWREDSSNRDPGRLRNRVRLEVLPGLNPAAVEHIGRLADIAREEESFWTGYIEELFAHRVQLGEGEWRLEIGDLVALPGRTRLPERQAAESGRAVARRLLRRVLRGVRGDLRRITQTHVEAVLALATEGQSGQRLALPGVSVERSFNQLVFRAASGSGETRVGAIPYYEVEVSGPGRFGLPSGRELEIKMVDLEDSASGCDKIRQRALDAERVGFPLLVRNWRPGDRYRPRDAHRAMKLKDLFQRGRMPRGERSRCAVVLCGDVIIWTAPFGPEAESALTTGSRKGIWIEEKAEG